MNTFNDIAAWISRQASIFTFVVLGFAGYLWGDELFCCPCNGGCVRFVYTLSLAFSPAFLIFVFDTHWTAVHASWIINKYCSLSSFTFFRRPLILAIAWLVYSGINPRFAECLTKDGNCTSVAEERKGNLLTAIAGGVLCLSFFTFAACIIYNIFCQRTYLFSRFPQNDKAEKSITEEKEEEEKLKKKLKGLTPKTLAVIVDEDLMNLHLLKSLTDEDFINLKDKITIGQMKILRRICREMNSPKQSSDERNTASGQSANCSAGHDDSSQNLKAPERQVDEKTPLLPKEADLLDKTSLKCDFRCEGSQVERWY
ncbi:uncharacterized protein LOC112554649 [Pomacea canaliculata]|uniref:uncharacterized protein LOC112554649 n=1 Tax=Pomacea canaliculata TaxID=400727 RepID=UPI000D72E34B|nr:uncharacterized protein LOC112554649 [Pomacea canaliculata]